ncbi:MAG: precorrin-6y C5,15-methyltransferase (decarboxylating) subunit CbiE [Azospirillaceae bacterium]
MSGDAPWLAVVGIGEDGLDGLSPPARRLVDGAEVLVGGARHLAMVPEAGDARERLTWPTPIEGIVEVLRARRGRPACVLASGDPMEFGVGTMLSRWFPAEERVIVPAVSSAALACARLGWPREETTVVSTLGRPLAAIIPHLQPGARLLVLSTDAATPSHLAALLRERGCGPSRLTLLERLGGPEERIRSVTAADWSDPEVEALNIVAVACRPKPAAPLYPTVPGLPDSAFHHDGKLTKRAVRAATLAALAPTPGAHLWDVGAGSGAVGIEWMRAARGATADAIEPIAERRAMIDANAAALGTPGLAIVAGAAPGALEGLAPPDAIFIGGGITTDGLIERCWAALRPGGRLVANVVTLEGEARVMEAAGRLGGALERIAVSRAVPVGEYHGFKPQMSVTQWAVTKTVDLP